MAPVKETLDYYAILNISQLASVQEIKKAYHRLALLHHPDKNQGSVSAAETFKKVLDSLMYCRVEILIVL
jgi:DnaJ-class molecular chaperone